MKYSRQREIIKDLILKKKYEHPTAQEIYDEIKKEEPTISLATVYRNLSFLSDTGVIRKINYVSNTEHYDPILEEHFHFVCTKCGKISNLSIKTQFDKMDEIIKNETKGEVNRHELIVYGVCGECKK